ncbi:Lipid storage droplets surface-binding protein [Trichinella spiralis]|uniref:Lipid storage droplets surface-binding protein n=1 Tax=Trichinella spiralis TaxID=6334 RepID=A0ABR3L2N1_TRISP
MADLMSCVSQDHVPLCEKNDEQETYPIDQLNDHSIDDIFTSTMLTAVDEIDLNTRNASVAESNTTNENSFESTVMEESLIEEGFPVVNANQPTIVTSRNDSFENFEKLPVNMDISVPLNAFELYGRAKKGNQLLNCTLDTTEATLKAMAGNLCSLPLIRLLLTPVNILDKFACSQFDKIEARYPIIKSNLDDIYEFTKHLYEGSYLKKGIDSVCNFRDFGVQKIHDTREMCFNLLETVKEMKEFNSDMGYAICISQHILNTVLEFTDAYITKHIPEYDKERLKTETEEADMYMKRMKNLYCKVQCKLTFCIMKMVSSTFSYAKEISFAEIVEENKQKVINFVKRNYSAFASNFDQTVVKIFHLLAMNAAFLSHQISKCCVVHLPLKAQTVTMSAFHHIDNICNTILEAQSTDVLKEEFITEATLKIDIYWQHICEAINSAADCPLINWLAISVEGIEFDEDLLIIDPSQRLPMPGVIELYIQPRLICEIRRG